MFYPEQGPLARRQQAGQAHKHSDSTQCTPHTQTEAAAQWSLFRSRRDTPPSPPPALPWWRPLATRGGGGKGGTAVTARLFHSSHAAAEAQLSMDSDNIDTDVDTDTEMEEDTARPQPMAGFRVGQKRKAWREAAAAAGAEPREACGRKRHRKQKN